MGWVRVRAAGWGVSGQEQLGAGGWRQKAQLSGRHPGVRWGLRLRSHALGRGDFLPWPQLGPKSEPDTKVML